MTATLDDVLPHAHSWAVDAVRTMLTETGQHERWGHGAPGEPGDWIAFRSSLELRIWSAESFRQKTAWHRYCREHGYRLRARLRGPDGSWPLATEHEDPVAPPWPVHEVGLVVTASYVQARRWLATQGADVPAAPAPVQVQLDEPVQLALFAA